MTQEAQSRTRPEDEIRQHAIARVIDPKAMRTLAQWTAEARNTALALGGKYSQDAVLSYARDNYQDMSDARNEALKKALTIMAIPQDPWLPRIGDRVEPTESCKYGADFRGEPMYVTGLAACRNGDGVDVTVCDEWPLRHNSNGGTDGFLIARAHKPDDLKPWRGA